MSLKNRLILYGLTLGYVLFIITTAPINLMLEIAIGLGIIRRPTLEETDSALRALGIDAKLGNPGK